MLPILAAAAFVCNSLSVDAPRAYAMGKWAGLTFAADFNGDGRPDVGSSNLETFTIRYNTGEGQLSEPVSLPYAVRNVADMVGDALPDLALNGGGVRENRGGDFSTLIPTMATDRQQLAADFTGDGKADLLAVDAGRSTLVLLSFAGGTPQKIVQFTLGLYRGGLVPGDLNGDGHLDFIARHIHSGEYRVFLNDGRGNFNDHGYRYFEGWFELADLDGDRRADQVAIVMRRDTYVGMRIFHADGMSADVALPGEALGAPTFEVFDFDGDGDPDLTVRMPPHRRDVHLYRNDGGGRLTRLPQKLFGANIVAVTDFTGDRITDLLIASDTGSVTIIPGAGDGTFRVPPTFDVPPAASYSDVVASDVDGDGLDELIYLIGGEHGGVVVARPDGSGGFTVEPLPGATGYSLSASRGEIAVASHDGRILVFSRRAHGGWGVYRAFNAPVPSYTPTDMELADLDGDGKNELAVIAHDTANRSLRVIEVPSRRVLLDQPLPANQYRYELFVHGRLLLLTLSGTQKVKPGGTPPYYFDPDGRVTAYRFRTSGVVQQTVMSKDAFLSTVAGDFNGDGYVDVLSSNLLAYGRPGGTFAPPETVDGIGLNRVAGDLNGDDMTDLVTNDPSGFTYVLGARAGLQPAPAQWSSGATGLPTIARLRAEGPPSLIFNAEELIEVRTQCIAPVGKRRGVRH